MALTTKSPRDPKPSPGLFTLSQDKNPNFNLSCLFNGGFAGELMYDPLLDSNHIYCISILLIYGYRLQLRKIFVVLIVALRTQQYTTTTTCYRVK